MAQQRNILVSVVFRVVVCAVLLFIAIGIFSILRATAPKPAASDSGVVMPRVEVMEAQPVAVQRQWEGFGTAAAMEAANVPARVTATVLERPESVRPGQPIQQNQLLVQLDDSDFVKQVETATQAISDIDAQLARLEVEQQSWTRRVELASQEVALVQAELERVRQALERDAARQREVDQIQRGLFAAQQAETAVREELDKIAPRRASLVAQRLREEANLRLAQLKLERSRIVAPINGVLAAVDVDVGENISVGQRVARIVNPYRIEVPLRLPASARPFISTAVNVQLIDTGASTGSLGGWAAQVTRLSPVDDESTRTMTVYAEVTQSPDDANTLAPGRFVRGVVRSAVSENRWVVPRRALTGERILTIDDNRVRSRSVEVDFNVQADLPALGLSDQQWVVLKHPLPERSLVVVDGSRALAEGAEVVPIVAHAAMRSESP